MRARLIVTPGPCSRGGLAEGRCSDSEAVAALAGAGRTLAAVAPRASFGYRRLYIRCTRVRDCAAENFQLLMVKKGGHASWVQEDVRWGIHRSNMPVSNFAWTPVAEVDANRNVNWIPREKLRQRTRGQLLEI